MTRQSHGGQPLPPLPLHLDHPDHHPPPPVTSHHILNLLIGEAENNTDDEALQIEIVLISPSCLPR